MPGCLNIVSLSTIFVIFMVLLKEFVTCSTQERYNNPLYQQQLQ